MWDSSIGSLLRNPHPLRSFGTFLARRSIVWKVLEIFGIKTSEADSGSTLIFLASRYSGPGATG